MVAWNDDTIKASLNKVHCDNDSLLNRMKALEKTLQNLENLTYIRLNRTDSLSLSKEDLEMIVRFLIMFRRGQADEDLDRLLIKLRGMLK